MVKKVIYNGGTQSLNSYSDPSSLIVGKEYEVVSVEVYNWHTDYTLKGIKGTFNSVWFDEVTDAKVYMAMAKALPKIGEKFNCYKLDMEQRNFVECCISPVKGIEHIGNNIYKVKACNSLYIVSVIDSVWIDEAYNENVYMAIANNLPNIGKRYECCKLDMEKRNYIGWSTSPVKSAEHIGNNIYKVTTLNSVYFVEVKI